MSSAAALPCVNVSGVGAGDGGVLRLRSDGIEWREVDGEILVVRLDGSSYFSVNGSGIPLWRELERGATREQLVNVLADRFPVSRERAARDVEAFLERLSAAGLIT